MIILASKAIISLDGLVPGTLSLKGSFVDGSHVYLIYAVSKSSTSPILLSTHPTYLEAKEVVNQINLAMDNISS